MTDQPADTAPVALTGELEAVVLRYLETEIAKRQKTVKSIIGQGYGDGDKRSIRSPLGDKLGSISRTDPDPTWRVVDREALHQHLRQDTANLETVYDLDLPDGSDVTLHHCELVAVLLEHAPQLLVERAVVADTAVSLAIAHAVSGKPVPGIARVKPGGTLTVRPDKSAGAAIEKLVESGMITWDGRPVLEAAS